MILGADQDSIASEPRLGLRLRQAGPEDLPDLVQLSIEAFRDDNRFKPSGAYPGGPAGHDQLDYHRDWLNRHHYLVCEQQGRMVGSVMVEVTGTTASIHGIHVSTDAMGQGVGSWMLQAVERALPSVQRWTLETPDYAIRNHHFYEKNGYNLEKTTPPESKLGFGFHIYQKKH